MRAGYVPPGELANLSGGTLVTEPKGIEPMTDPGMIHAQDQRSSPDRRAAGESDVPVEEGGHGREVDRKSTRLNSSHGYISYAVFCLKKKNTRPLRTSSCAY